MDLDQFWQIIARSLEQSGGDKGRQLALLEAELREYAPEELRSFHAHRNDCLRRGRDHRLLNTQTIIAGGGWAEDFCDWLISRGRAVYEAALADPDSLADVVDAADAEDRGLFQFPGDIPGSMIPFSGAAARIHREKTGEVLPGVAFNEFRGKCLHENEELAAAYPRLWAKFGDRSIRRVEQANAEFRAREKARKAATGVKWMDYSGAPAVLVPERCWGYWYGTCKPFDPDDDEWDDDDEPAADFVLPDGRGFVETWEIDFEDPQTHFDHICATSPEETGTHWLHEVETGEILVISDGADSFGWWEEKRMLITSSTRLPDLSKIKEDDWCEPIFWTIPQGKLRLMNSADHAANPELRDDHYFDFSLEPGEYRIDTATYTVDICMKLYRFTKL